MCVGPLLLFLSPQLGAFLSLTSQTARLKRSNVTTVRVCKDQNWKALFLKEEVEAAVCTSASSLAEL